MAKVFLNVYDLNQNNNTLRAIGLGMYHSGVEVHGVEHTYGQEGIGHHEPKKVNGAVFRESIELGETKITSEQISYLANELGKEGFSGNQYSLTKNNCNHFARALCLLVFKEDKADRFPKWINRMAWLGAKMPFLLTPTSPQSPTTPNQQSNTPNSPATDSPTKSFTPFSGSGKKLNRTGSIKSVFSKKPDSPGTADREQVLRATQNRFATNSPTTK